MYKYKGPVTKTEDPDGRRYNFFVQVYNDKELNKLVWKMLGEGFDLVPKTELIQQNKREAIGRVRKKANGKIKNTTKEI